MASSGGQGEAQQQLWFLHTSATFKLVLYDLSWHIAASLVPAAGLEKLTSGGKKKRRLTETLTILLCAKRECQHLALLEKSERLSGG